MTHSFSQKEVLLTSESVTEGHPDKLCDQISDAVLDAILEEDSFARVACECAVTTGLVLVGGEITTECYVDIPQIARQVICKVGYNSSEVGFDGATCGVLNVVKEQSKDIKKGVDQSLEVRQKKGKKVDADLQIGAGDQGLMIGFACRESEEYMPLTIVLAHKLCQRLAQVRKKGKLPYLGPDGKSQVTIRYQKGRPQEVTAVVLSSQHSEEVTHKEIRKDLLEEVVKKVIPSRYLTENTIYYINPSGRFVLGGPIADSGLTGRKIMVDSYGGIVRHGGGCFSGKDATKVDRSANYAARWVAKNLVAAGLADRMEVNLAYAIGVAQPLAISVETFGTGKIADEKIVKIIREVFDLRPGAIIRDLKLRRPLYLQVAAYGHFGRLDLDLPWEKLDRVEAIKKLT